MKNQEEIMAYLAGALDGDGSFSLCKSAQRGKNPGPSYLYYPVIQLSNTYECLIDLFVESFGGRKHIRKAYIAKDGGSRKINYHWMIQRQPACEPMLEKITPFLIIKKERATFLLDYIKNNRFKRGSNVLSNDVIKNREKSYQKMKSFNNERKIPVKCKTVHADNDSDNPLFWSYLAGYMDTDGSFTIVYRKNHTNMVSPAFSQLIQISSIDIKSIEFLLKNFRGGKVAVRKGKNCKTGLCYKYTLSNRDDVQRFSEKLLPYLICKNKQAQTMIDFCKSFEKTKYCKGKVPESILNFRMNCRDKIMQYNRCDLYKSPLMDLKIPPDSTEDNKAEAAKAGTVNAVSEETLERVMRYSELCSNTER